MLAGQISNHDEEEVEEELEAMENEINGRNKLKDSLHHLPAAPKTEPTKAESSPEYQEEESDRTTANNEREAIPL